MRSIMGGLVRIASIVPQSCAAAVAGDYISLKNLQKMVVLVTLGAITTSVTVRLRQAIAVAGTGVKALLIYAVWRKGAKLSMGTVVGAFAVGETITGGTSGATGIIYSINTSELVIHTITGTFAAAETITGGTSGATAVVSAAITENGLKMRVPLATPASTVVLTNDNETYEIEVEPSDLDVANDFDCVVADVSAVGGGAGLAAITYIGKALYTEDPQKSLLID